MEPVFFENHKLDWLIPKVKSWLFTHKNMLKDFVDGIKLFIQTIE